MTIAKKWLVMQCQVKKVFARACLCCDLAREFHTPTGWSQTTKSLQAGNFCMNKVFQDIVVRSLICHPSRIIPKISCDDEKRY